MGERYEWERERDRSPREWERGRREGEWENRGGPESERYYREYQAGHGGRESNEDHGTESDWRRGRSEFGQNRESQGFGAHRYEQERGGEGEWRRGRTDYDRPRSEQQWRDSGREDWGRSYGREHWGQGSYGREGSWGGGAWKAETQHSGRPETGWDERGDWGRQSVAGTYGTRPNFDREHMERFNQSSYYGGGMQGYSGGMGQYGERWSHAGRGPKGWKRSDDRIKDDINERLTDHPAIDASDIEVEVKEGEVTLRGAVDNRHAKRLAEDLVDMVPGVKEVWNELRTSRSQSGLSTQTTGATNATASKKL
jgi:hypothetical protein